MREDVAWRRRPVVPCSAADVERRARAFLAGRRATDVALLPGGKCNSNYAFRAGGERFVLRLYARGDRAAPGRERAATSLAEGLVPVPRPLAWGEGWAVQPFLPGRPLTTRARREAVVAAARAAAAVASVRLPSAGDLAADGSVRPWPFDGLPGFVERCLARPRARESLGDLVDGVRALVRRERGCIAEMESDPRLVHGDFRPGNVLYLRGRVTGVLDWEFAHAGSPYGDVGNLLRHLGPRRAPWVEAGLREGGFDVPPDWLRRAALADLSSHLEFLASDDVRDAAFRRACVDRVRALLA